MVELSGLNTLAKDAAGNIVRISASLDTTAPFTASSALTCADIVRNAKTENMRTFLDNYGIDDKDNSNAVNKSIKDKLASFKNALVTADVGQTISRGISGYTEINTFLSDLNTKQLPILRLVDNCLKEDQQIDMTEYNSAKAIKEESKSRLESILTPEQHISYYEGWFPIVRPMTEFSLFALFGTALFLLLVSIMVFLSMSGVVLQIQIPDLLLPQALEFLNYYLPPGSSYYLYAGLFFGLVATGIAFRFKYI
jgi:hypothetical protein